MMNSVESIGEIKDVEEGNEERVGELANTLNHVMNIDNEQSKSNMVLKNLDVLKDCKQFSIFPDALELKKQRNSCHMILNLEENIQEEDDNACMEGGISDEKVYSKTRTGFSLCSQSGVSLPGRGHTLFRCSHTDTGPRPLFLCLQFLDLVRKSLVPFTRDLSCLWSKMHIF